MAETCGTCRNHHHGESPDEYTCRLAPPRVFLMGLNPAGQPMFVSTWPPVQRDSWCAMWAGQKRTMQ